MAVTSPVLVGFAEALSAPECVWSLQEAGFTVHAFARASRRPPLRRLRGVVVHTVRAPEQDAAGTAADLGALLARLHPTAVLPLDDAAMCIAADCVPGSSAVLAGPTAERLELAVDKGLQVAAAGRAGFRTPYGLVCTQRATPGLDAVSLPAIVRPARAIQWSAGRTVRAGATACATREQVTAAVEAILPTGPALVQELVPGIGEGLFGLARDGHVAAWSAHRRLRMMNPAGSGSSACVSVAPDPKAQAAAARMLREACWNGLFMIELLRDARGEAWFVELNGRPWGSMALARRAGLEYPAWAVRHALGEEPAPQPVFVEPGIRCRHLGRELVHLLFVMRGPRDASAGWPARGASLREVLTVRRDDRWYNWRAGNAGVFFDDALRTVSSAVGRRAA